MVEEHGASTLDRYLAELLDYTERLARAEITAMPDGKYYFEDKLDDDGVNLKNEVTIRLTITVDGDELVYDFDGTDPQVASSMNNPLGSTRSAVVTAVRSMMGGDVPHVEVPGIALNVPDGSLLNPHPLPRWQVRWNCSEIKRCARVPMPNTTRENAGLFIWS